MARDYMSWRDEGACKGMYDLFFPAGVEDTEESEDEAEAANLEEARAVCRTCPALIMCGQNARTEEYGIQAGTTRKMRRERQ